MRPEFSRFGIAKGSKKVVDSNINAVNAGGYYEDTAYQSGALPKQADQHEELNRSALGLSASLRLPWGNARDVLPPDFLSDHSPKKLRKLERREDLAKKIGLQSENNHECFRYATLALRARFFDMMGVFGKLWLFLVTPVGLADIFLMSPLFANDGETWSEYLHSIATPAVILLLGGGALLWLFSYMAVRHFTSYLLKAGRGPEWEFNRRTGIVTVWQYPRNPPLMPRKPPTVIEKPFYEFDAWCCARVDRHGSLFDLVLSHRYSKLDVTVGDILGSHGHPNMCYAFWDFIQNYMDVSKPLPDFPLLEQYRHLDPVTAEHDLKTDRPACYWRDMDMDTFKKKVDRMHTDVTIIDTVSRPNLMEGIVRYAT